MTEEKAQEGDLKGGRGDGVQQLEEKNLGVSGRGKHGRVVRAQCAY